MIFSEETIVILAMGEFIGLPYPFGDFFLHLGLPQVKHQEYGCSGIDRHDAVEAEMALSLA